MEFDSIDEVLVLAPMADGETWPAISDAFRRHGLDVQQVDLDQRNSDEVLSAAESFDGELIMCAREKVLADNIGDIRELSGAPRVVTWNTDVRYDIREWKELLPLFRFSSVYYTPALGNIGEWRREGVMAFWLPQGLDDRLYQAVDPDGLDEETRRKYSCDVSFIGGDYGLHEGRSDVLDALEESDLDVKFWGCRGGEEVWGEEHNRAVACSKVCLCHSGWPQLDCYMSVRNYKVMGAGGVCLSNAHRGMEAWLPVRGSSRMMEIYQTPEECLEQIHCLLENDEERRMVARNGRQWAEKNTYEDRIGALLTHLSPESGKYFGDEKAFDQRVLSPMDLEPYDWIFSRAEMTNENDGGDQMNDVEQLSAEPKRDTSVDEEDCRIVTVLSPEVFEQSRYFFASLAEVGWGDPVTVIWPECEEPPPEITSAPYPVETVVRPRWYEEYAEQDFMYCNDCYLKPFAGDVAREGERVLFVDGADTFFLSDPRDYDHSPLALLDLAPMACVPGVQNEKPSMGPLDDLLEIQGRLSPNDGVFAFRAGEETEGFFQLWKSLCVASIQRGLSDMSAFDLALRGWRSEVSWASRAWNWLAGEEAKYRLGGGPCLYAIGSEDWSQYHDLRKGEEQKLHIVHGAGDGRQVFNGLCQKIFEENE